MALDLSKKIGKGSFGDVWKVNVDISVPNEMACNITSIRPLATHMNDVLKESKKLSQLNHTNIVRLFFVRRFAESNRRSFVCLFMELCDGDLKTVIESSRRLTENRAHQWFIQIVEALKYLHEQNIVNLDIKPHNILFKQNGQNSSRYHFKLSDFGLSEKYSEGINFTKTIGTYKYMAPEVANTQVIYNPMPADIYSLGVTLAESLTGIDEKNLNSQRFIKLLNAAKLWESQCN